MFRGWVSAVALVLVAPIWSGCLPRTPSELARHETRLIEFGWDMPDPKFLRANVHRMEELPFDGVVVNTGLHAQVFTRRSLPPTAIAEALENLRATPFRRFTDNFLLVWVVPADLGWFEDWTPVFHNLRLVARLAKAGGLRGIFLDTEQYTSPLFAYRKQRERHARSFSEYAARARLQGWEVMRALAVEYPDLTIIVTLAYHAAEYDVAEEADRSEAAYALLPPFLDGLLEGAPETVTLVDGFEFSYGFRREFEFVHGRWLMRHWAPRLSGLRDRHRPLMRVGYGLWLDYQWRSRGWHPAEPGRNHFTPEGFAEALHLALRHTDRYVWVYTEQPNWWTGKNLSPAYRNALGAARR